MSQLTNPIAQDRSALLGVMRSIALEAGELILKIYVDPIEFASKEDGSPVTWADTLADAAILAKLKSFDASIPIVSEESAGIRLNFHGADRFWLVDPLDGTKEFINRNGEFTVNIGLIENGSPVAGVVYAPALGSLYAGAIGVGAFKEDLRVGKGLTPISSNAPNPVGLVMVQSRSHADHEAIIAFLKKAQISKSKAIGSSLKLCLIADAQADLYPRLGRTMEWDIAAGDAILRSAGGKVVNMMGEQLHYGKMGFENPYFVALAKGLELSDLTG